MDPKTATKLDEVDLLRLQNVALRMQLLQAEQAGIVQALAAKYKADGQHLSINQDTGEIARISDPVASP